MRLSFKKAVQWTFIFIMLQLVVYYWSTRKSTKSEPNAPDGPNAPVRHNYLKTLMSESERCTPQNCPAVKPEVINVHLIPHSHFDVGWTKTVEQYYVGDPVEGVWASGCVRCTFNGSIGELLKNTSRRFIFVEMKYLARYWNEITDTQRSDMLQLIKERRLEIANGGWVMSDAGVTMYNDIIDQHTMGFDFIRNTFGPCAQSRNGWHVDQFGHSREHASIFAQMGYDSLFIGRLDYRDIEHRKLNREMELIWETSPRNYRDQSYLFTHIFHDGYYAPSGYNFENDYVDWSNKEHADIAARNFIAILTERAQTIQTNHMLIPMGCDFGYRSEAAEVWFSNMDKLIAAVHAKQNLRSQNLTFNLLYSTPSCYTYHVNKMKYELPVKRDDFHPYGIAPGAYWTGYFTTRGGLKMHIKRAGQILQACKHLAIFSALTEMTSKVNDMRDTMAIMQHHDAITGTQRMAVLQDYNVLLSQGIEQCETVMSLAYQWLWNMHDSNNSISRITGPQFHFCQALNISSCDVSENSQEFLISLYNPLSWVLNLNVRFPVNSKKVTILNGVRTIPVQVVPIPKSILDIPEREKTKSDKEAVFEIQVPPMSIAAVRVNAGKDDERLEFEPNPDSNDLVIENEHLSLKFKLTSGLLTSMFNKDSNIEESLQQDFAYYTVKTNGERTSGAYLFVPENDLPEIIAKGKVEIKLIKGSVVQEVHQKFSSWVSQIVRLYKGSRCAEFQWVVGPLELRNGMEVVSRFKSALKSGNNFFTDSNGREVMKRIRKTLGENSSYVADAVSGNYYAITSRIFIQDEDKKTQLTVLPDRPQGGGSLRPGSIELLLHRKTIADDNLGLAQQLDDKGVDGKGIIFTGKHFVCLDTIDKSSTLTRQLALQIHLGPVPMFSSLDLQSPVESVPQQLMFLTRPLPDNLHILTLDRIPNEDVNFFLLRLEHIFENGENHRLSGPVEINLESLFKAFKIVSAEETSLGGNFIPNDIKRMNWNIADRLTPGTIQSPNYKENMEPPFQIQLLPMEIRTFRVSVVWYS